MFSVSYPFFDEDYAKLTPGTKGSLSGDMLLESLAIVGRGPNLLMIPAHSDQGLLEFREHRIVRKWALHLPSGYVISSLLGMDKDSWKILASSPQRGDSTSKNFQTGPIFEFDPYGGRPLRRIEMREDPPLVFCEHEGTYTGITMNQNDGSIQLVQAKAQP